MPPWRCGGLKGDAGAFMDNVKIHKAGGGFGILTAFIAYYAGASALITHDNRYAPQSAQARNAC